MVVVVGGSVVVVTGGRVVVINGRVVVTVVLVGANVPTENGGGSVKLGVVDVVVVGFGVTDLVIEGTTTDVTVGRGGVQFPEVPQPASASSGTVNKSATIFFLWLAFISEPRNSTSVRPLSELVEIRHSYVFQLHSHLICQPCQVPKNVTDFVTHLLLEHGGILGIADSLLPGVSQLSGLPNETKCAVVDSVRSSLSRLGVDCGALSELLVLIKIHWGVPFSYLVGID